MSALHWAQTWANEFGYICTKQGILSSLGTQFGFLFLDLEMNTPCHCASYHFWEWWGRLSTGLLVTLVLGVGANMTCHHVSNHYLDWGGRLKDVHV